MDNLITEKRIKSMEETRVEIEDKFKRLTFLEYAAIAIISVMLVVVFISQLNLLAKINSNNNLYDIERIINESDNFAITAFCIFFIAGLIAITINIIKFKKYKKYCIEYFNKEGKLTYNKNNVYIEVEKKKGWNIEDGKFIKDGVQVKINEMTFKKHI